MAGPLPRSFFARDADIVARDLLGRILVHEVEGERLACRIVETEAYFGPPGRNAQLATRSDMPARLRARLLREGDPASHSYRGVTPRNGVMYGPPGVAYVYLIYGMHECMNVVTGPAEDHEPQAVLLRAGEPLDGLASMMARRRVSREVDVASGPAKLAKAMMLTRPLTGRDITRGALHVEEGAPWPAIQTTPRIGVTGAADLRLRYVARGSPHVSKAPASSRRAR